VPPNHAVKGVKEGARGGYVFQAGGSKGGGKKPNEVRLPTWVGEREEKGEVKVIKKRMHVLRIKQFVKVESYKKRGFLPEKRSHGDCNPT